MKKVALLLSLAVSVFCFPALSQKVTFSSSNDTIPFGTSSYTADIKVAQFKQIVGAQFSLNWDSTVLSFKDVTNFGFNLSYDDNFGRDQISSGVLRFAWFNGALTGVDLADDTTLFSIEFDVIGDSDSFSDIAFSDEPTAREVYDTSFAVVAADYLNGAVMIGSGGVSNLQADPGQLNIRSISPNPVSSSQESTLQLFLKKADTLDIRIFSINGREVYHHQGFYPAGVQHLDIPSKVLTQSGLYIIQIHNNRFITTDKLIITE